MAALTAASNHANRGLMPLLLALLLHVTTMSSSAAATTLINPCLWAVDGKCSWNVLFPVALADASTTTAQSSSMATKQLIGAALAVELCLRLTDQTTCAASSRCSWQAEESAALTAQLTGLAANCTPANVTLLQATSASVASAAVLDGVLAAEVLTVSSRCAAATTAAACRAVRPAVVLDVAAACELAAAAGVDDEGGCEGLTDDEGQDGGDEDSTVDSGTVDGSGEETDGSNGGSSDDTMNLRIAGVFVILVGGLMGCGAPIMFKRHLRPETLWYRVLQCFSAGIFLSLSMLHLLPEAVANLDGLAEGAYGTNVVDEGEEFYPVGMCTVILGFLLIVFTEQLALMFGIKHSHNVQDSVEARTQHSHDSSIMSTCAPYMVDPELGTSVAVPETAALPPPPAAVSAHDATSQHQHDLPASAATSGTATPVTPASSLKAKARAAAQLTASIKQLDALVRLRLRITVYLFELGCVFHSVIIGVLFGVTTDVGTARTLLIALPIHQFLEGIALGSFVMHSGLWWGKQLLMVLVYSLACPVGAAIGIGISSTYNPESLTARAVQGVFDGIAAGMLLYLAFTLVWGELHCTDNRKLIRLGCCVAMTLGAACFAALAVWA